MDEQNEDKFHKDMADFMDTTNYKICFAVIPCDKTPTDLVRELKSKGYEIFPSVIKAGDECKIFYRKVK